MDLYSKIAGTSVDSFQVGLTGNVIATNTDGLAVQNESATPKNLTVARPQGTNQDVHAASYLDVKERGVLIEFSFAGGLPPSPGANTGKYGLCHTSGGIYNAGQVYLDTGAAIAAVTINKGHLLCTTTAITGTVSMIANGLYSAQAGSAPYTWTLKGDVLGSSSGITRAIKLNLGATAGNIDSTTNVPALARMMRVFCNVKVAYDGAATIAVSVNGGAPTTIMTTAENRPNKIGLYLVTPYIDIALGNGGLLRATIGGAPTVGLADVTVEYYENFLA